MKKLLTAFLTVFCTLMISVPVLAFEDVLESDWFCDAVYDAEYYGLMNGTGDNTFSPYQTMTRGMFVTVLGRMERVGCYDYSGDEFFSDVSYEDYYATYVSWAYEHDIVDGVGNGKFDPNQMVTREQMAKMIYGYIESIGYQLQFAEQPAAAFRDTAKISSWAKEGMEAMRLYGIIQGDHNGNCNPQNGTTRAEAATMLVRLYEMMDYNNVKDGWSLIFDMVDTDEEGNIYVPCWEEFDSYVYWGEQLAAVVDAKINGVERLLGIIQEYTEDGYYTSALIILNCVDWELHDDGYLYPVYAFHSRTELPGIGSRGLYSVKNYRVGNSVFLHLNNDAHFGADEFLLINENGVFFKATPYEDPFTGFNQCKLENGTLYIRSAYNDWVNEEFVIYGSWNPVTITRTGFDFFRSK